MLNKTSIQSQPENFFGSLESSYSPHSLSSVAGPNYGPQLHPPNEEGDKEDEYLPHGAKIIKELVCPWWGSDWIVCVVILIFLRCDSCQAQEDWLEIHWGCEVSNENISKTHG
jgi:hypothetical protein